MSSTPFDFSDVAVGILELIDAQKVTAQMSMAEKEFCQAFMSSENSSTRLTVRELWRHVSRKNLNELAAAYDLDRRARNYKRAHRAKMPVDSNRRRYGSTMHNDGCLIPKKYHKVEICPSGSQFAADSVKLTVLAKYSIDTYTLSWEQHQFLQRYGMLDLTPTEPDKRRGLSL